MSNIIGFDKDRAEPYLEMNGLTAYVNWDWNDSSKPWELYVFDGDELLYKYWFSTGIGRYFIDSYTYPSAKDEIDTIVKCAKSQLPTVLRRFSAGRPGGLLG